MYLYSTTWYFLKKQNQWKKHEYWVLGFSREKEQQDPVRQPAPEESHISLRDGTTWTARQRAKETLTALHWSESWLLLGSWDHGDDTGSLSSDVFPEFLAQDLGEAFILRSVVRAPSTDESDDERALAENSFKHIEKAGDREQKKLYTSLI